MRLVYVDEAGISKDEPIAVVCAAIVHADEQLVRIERSLNRLVARVIPAEHQEGFVFHATELFNGGGKVFKRDQWPMEERLKVADALTATVRRFQLPLIAGWVEKSKLAKAHSIDGLWDNFAEKDRAIFVHVSSYLACLLKVEFWMRDLASNEVCMMIVEDNNEARAMIRLFHRLRQGDAFAGISTVRIKKIKEDPLFQTKRPGSVLQLADFCAYVLKKSLMGDSRYDRFMGPIGGQFHKTFASDVAYGPLH